MKLGLYSRAARRNITALKKAMGGRAMGSSPEEVRDFRRRLMMEQDAETLGDLLNFRDFYNLDECRDLLFHPMEHCFDLPGIRRGVKEAGLKFVNFLGVDHQEFRRETGAETGDLAAWGEYENAAPGHFPGQCTSFFVKSPERRAGRVRRKAHPGSRRFPVGRDGGGRCVPGRLKRCFTGRRDGVYNMIPGLPDCGLAHLPDAVFGGLRRGDQMLCGGPSAGGQVLRVGQMLYGGQVRVGQMRRVGQVRRGG